MAGADRDDMVESKVKGQAKAKAKAKAAARSATGHDDGLKQLQKDMKAFLV